MVFKIEKTGTKTSTLSQPSHLYWRSPVLTLLVGASGEVMVRRKTGLPARERHSTLWWQILDMNGSDWNNTNRRQRGSWGLTA